jgi:tetracycline 7-halogenase / FADH2 O2-dependent halogenase
MMLTADVAIVGSGFAGSLMALGLVRQGQRVVILERGRHPRFAIGESSTPLANLLLEELADRYDLPYVRSFSKWGTWQQSHPEVACGLKRGFTFYFHEPGKPFSDDRRHERQLMVAASPCDRIADTHWYRPDFDHALVRHAQHSGATYLDDTSIERLTFGRAGAVIDATRDGSSLSIHAGFCRRCQRAARLPAPDPASRGVATAVAAADGRALFPFRTG